MEQRVVFKDKSYLEVHGWSVAYYYSDGTPERLTGAQQRILAMLVQTPGAVSFSRLYESYSKKEADQSVNTKVTNIRSGLPEEIRKCVKSVSGYGYQLDRTKVTLTDISTRQERTAQEQLDEGPRIWIPDLTGEYYCFYLDPVGDGTLLGAYLSIENRGDEQIPDVSVNAILGIRGDAAWARDDFGAVFRNDVTDHVGSLEDFSKELSDNGQRCFLAQGKIKTVGSVAVIELDTPGGEYWGFLFDLYRYLTSPRKTVRKARCYRGGMGLGYALTKQDSSFFFRAALVRKECRKSRMTLSNQNIKSQLTVEAGQYGKVHRPLILEYDLDKEWYNWFMDDER